MRKPKVSGHAVFRYLDRTGKIDRKAVEREILTPELIAAIKAGATSYKTNGFTYVIDKGTVVTVIEGERVRAGKNPNHSAST